MKKIKENQGITLIALVITIIVLLILAGVSIVMLTGQNGILTQAQNAVKQNKEAGAMEKVKLAVTASQTEEGIDYNKLKNELNSTTGIKEKIEEMSSKDFPTKIIIDNTTLNIFSNGEVEVDKSSEQAYAMIYDNGYKLSDGVTEAYEMVIQRGDNIDEGKNLVKKCENIETEGGSSWLEFRDNIEKVEIRNLIKPIKLEEFFGALKNCTTIQGLCKIDTSNCTSINAMFYGNTNLKNFDINDLNVSTITDYRWAFSKTDSITSLVLENWDVSNGENFDGMISECHNLENIKLGKWNTQKGKTFYAMFSECSNLKEIYGLENWDTSNFNNIGNMFFNCTSLTNINVSNWNTENVTEGYQVFYNCFSLQNLDISNWNTTNMVNISSIFEGMDNLKQISLGNKFSFTGNGDSWSALPKGTWKSGNTGIEYSYNTIPNLKADTYIKVN